MNLALRKEILQSLPVGAPVYYQRFGKQPTTYVKKKDRHSVMVVLQGHRKLSINYRNLTCDEIIKAQEVARRLSPPDDGGLIFQTARRFGKTGGNPLDHYIRKYPQTPAESYWPDN